jgi:ectoine hydroxylase-related dioxygenase (phytanoyl-CoA dioxygenase family)
MMIYLTDVDENSGCFTYIPESNKADLHSFKPTPVNKRISDDQISKFYSKTEWLKGKAGTILLVDANGLHAGPRWVDSNMNNLRSRTAVFINFSTLPMDKKLRNFFYKQSFTLQKIFTS